MTTVSMFEAKTNLSRYVASVEEQREPYIVITRSGKPVAKIVPFAEEKPCRVGLAEEAAAAVLAGGFQQHCFRR